MSVRKTTKSTVPEQGTEKSMEDMLAQMRTKEAAAAPVPTQYARKIPRGMVAFYGTDAQGKEIEGFQTPAGAKAMKSWVESQGGTLTIDEAKQTVNIDHRKSIPFNKNGGKCLTCS